MWLGCPTADSIQLWQIPKYYLFLALTVWTHKAHTNLIGGFTPTQVGPLMTELFGGPKGSKMADASKKRRNYFFLLPKGCDGDSALVTEELSSQNDCQITQNGLKSRLLPETVFLLFLPVSHKKRSNSEVVFQGKEARKPVAKNLRGWPPPTPLPTPMKRFHHSMCDLVVLFWWFFF